MQSLVAMPIGRTKQVSRAFFPLLPTHIRATYIFTRACVHTCYYGLSFSPLPFLVTDPVPVLFLPFFPLAPGLYGLIRLLHTDERCSQYASTRAYPCQSKYLFNRLDYTLGHRRRRRMNLIVSGPTQRTNGTPRH